MTLFAFLLQFDDILACGKFVPKVTYKMFSDRFYFAVGKLLPIFRFCGASAYLWCSNSRLFVRHEKYLNFGWLTYSLLHLWIAFHVYRLTVFYLAGNFTTFVILLAFFLSLIVMYIIFTILLIYDDTAFELFNSVLVFMRYLNRKFSKQNHTDYTFYLVKPLLILQNGIIQTTMPIQVNVLWR